MKLVTQIVMAASVALTASCDAVVDLDAPPDTSACTATQTLPSADTQIDPSAPLPALVFEGLDGTGTPTTVSLADYHEPCAAASRLLVVRVGAAFCGTCRWHAAHTQELFDLDVGSRLEVLDVLVRDEDNLPATAADLVAWRARIDAPQKLAVDPQYRFDALNRDRAKLPLVVLVDTKTMTVRRTLNDPDPDQLALRVRQELAVLDGTTPPADVASTLYDGVFTRNQRDMIAEMTGLGAPPADPTNAYADDPRAAQFGARLFGDRSLSPSGTVSCLSCHDPQRAWADGRPVSRGVDFGTRNAPSVALAAHARWQFWDGRADSLWAQALGPFENPKEFGSSRLFVVQRVAVAYRPDYEALFGPLPDLSALPANGAPGDPAWEALSPQRRDAINRVFVNIGKSIAAFERTVRIGENAVDAYARGNTAALSVPQKAGLRAFFDVGCAQCHHGSRLTDDAFHVIKFRSRSPDTLDHGRIDAVSQLLASEFLETGPYSDAPADTHGLAALRQMATLPSSLDGAFRTPALRGVANTSPYAHAGSLGGGGPIDAAGLDALIGHYTGGAIDDPTSPGFALAVGEIEPWVQKFELNGPQHRALAAFLPVLTGATLPPPPPPPQ